MNFLQNKKRLILLITIAVITLGGVVVVRNHNNQTATGIPLNKAIKLSNGTVPSLNESGKKATVVFTDDMYKTAEGRKTMQTELQQMSSTMEAKNNQTIISLNKQFGI